MKENYNEILYDNETMESKNIILRKFKKSDAADVLEYASDPQTIEHLIWAGSKTIEEAVGNITNYYWSKPGIYAIEYKEDQKCIGCIDLRLKLTHEKVSFGYVLNRRYWGRGIMTEALLAILELCFDKLELNRVEAGHFTGNEASGRVMEKCGMEKEGISKQSEKAKGIFRDEVHYGITRDRWNVLRSSIVEQI